MYIYIYTHCHTHINTHIYAGRIARSKGDRWRRRRQWWRWRQGPGGGGHTPGCRGGSFTTNRGLVVVRMCDMNHSYVWHESFMCMWHESSWGLHERMTCCHERISCRSSYVCGMTHSQGLHEQITRGHERVTRRSSYVWHDSFIGSLQTIGVSTLLVCVTWLILVRVTRLIHMCDMTHSCVCDTTHLYMTRDRFVDMYYSFIYVAWLIHRFDSRRIHIYICVHTCMLIWICLSLHLYIYT